MAAACLSLFPIGDAGVHGVLLQLALAPQRVPLRNPPEGDPVELLGDHVLLGAGAVGEDALPGRGPDVVVLRLIGVHRRAQQGHHRRQQDNALPELPLFPPGNQEAHLLLKGRGKGVAAVRPVRQG